MKTGVLGRMILWGGSAAILVVVSGLWFHTSKMGATVQGKYSPAYFFLALGITVSGLIGAVLLRFLVTEQDLNRSSGRRVRVSFRVKAFLLLGMGIFLFVAAETVLTVWDARQLRLGVSGAEFHPYLQAVPATDNERLSINRWGFRGEDITQIKPDSTFRVFVMGGSTVYCDRLPFEDSHPRVLQKRLQEAYTHVKVEVQNTGMHWHTSQHSLIKFLFHVYDFQPDLIILYHAVNDMCQSFSPPAFAHGDYRPDYGHMAGPVSNMVNDYFNLDGDTRFFSVNMGRMAFMRYWFSDLRQETPYMRRFQPETISINEWRSLESYRRNMTELSTIIHQRVLVFCWRLSLSCTGRE